MDFPSEEKGIEEVVVGDIAFTEALASDVWVEGEQLSGTSFTASEWGSFVM